MCERVFLIVGGKDCGSGVAVVTDFLNVIECVGGCIVFFSGVIWDMVYEVV